MSDIGRVLDELAERIEQRRGASPSESYTAQLLGGDENTLLKKIVEEAQETTLAAKDGAKQPLTEELADLVYHCVALMARYNVSLDELASVLQARSGQSGVAEKAARKQK